MSNAEVPDDIAALARKDAKDHAPTACLRKDVGAQCACIAVNDEYSVPDTFLRPLPSCVNPGARVAILTFHAGDDRRMKKLFAGGCRDDSYAGISGEVSRPTAAQIHPNPHPVQARLRWARRADLC